LQLGLSADTQRLSVQFMGCFGALSGMKAARAFACERSERKTSEARAGHGADAS